MFPIIDISDAAVIGDGQLSSKSNFWIFRHDEKWLFKETRGHTGDDWAEKIASEIAPLMGIEAARVQLAERAGLRGCLSLSFVDDDENLVLGNQILARQIVGYDRRKRLQPNHTFANIVTAVRTLMADAPRHTEVLRDLAGYMVFDALICNTDRHHENWGFLTRREHIDPLNRMMPMRLAPSFDHAYSLGRELRDARRQELLATDRIGEYVRRGRGGMYWRNTDAHGANPVCLVEVLAREFPDYFQDALGAVVAVSLPMLHEVVEEVPGLRMSPFAKEFAKSLLAHTRAILAGLRPGEAAQDGPG